MYQRARPTNDICLNISISSHCHTQYSTYTVIMQAKYLGWVFEPEGVPWKSLILRLSNSQKGSYREDIVVDII